MAAIELAQAEHNSCIVVAAQREKESVKPAKEESSTHPVPAELYPMGVLVAVTAIQKQSDNSAEISVEGVRRVKLDSFGQGGSAGSRVQLVQITQVDEAEAEITPERAALMRQACDLFANLGTAATRSNTDQVETAKEIKSVGRLADYLCAHMPKISADKLVADKQGLLEIVDPAERLEKVAYALAAEIELYDLETRIRNKVRTQMDRNQREFFLREQLKAIHDELGGEGGNEIADFRERVEAAGMPADITDKMLKEVSRLERMSSASPESNVVRTYLDWVLAMPWHSRTTDDHDLRRAADILDADHYGLDKIKDRILEFLAVRRLAAARGSKMRGPILCFGGPPGVGKTSLGQSIARSMGRKFVRISLGGVRDESEIRGHRRTYVGALPGRIITALIILLDEVDKMSSDFRGDPTAALLEVLDPEQNFGFVDHYLDLPFDLSEVLFITTANNIHNIPRPLLDRMEVIELGGYTEDEKVQIVKRYLLPKQLEANALQPNFVSASDHMLRLVIRNYTREAGVRNLERKIGTLCRKSARLYVDGKLSRRPTEAERAALDGLNAQVAIAPVDVATLDGAIAADSLPPKPKKMKPALILTEQRIEDFLGTARYNYGQTESDFGLSTNPIGVAMGLAYTEAGGEVLPVEVATMPGHGGVSVTGRLGEVMQESAKAAMTYVRSRARELGIAADMLEKTDIHIHLPEGAIPKDGPSAGITMATAIISALTNRLVRVDTAMTGEITLRGRVLAIGGLKEKTMAAHRAGIRRIIAPAQNRRDLLELPKNIARDIEWIWAESMDQVVREIYVVSDAADDDDDRAKAATPIRADLPIAASSPNAEIGMPATPDYVPDVSIPSTDSSAI